MLSTKRATVKKPKAKKGGGLVELSGSFNDIMNTINTMPDATELDISFANIDRIQDILAIIDTLGERLPVEVRSPPKSSDTLNYMTIQSIGTMNIKSKKQIEEPDMTIQSIGIENKKKIQAAALELASHIGYTTKLTKLEITSISKDGVIKLATLLHRMQKLKCLSIDNNVFNNGAIAIAAALPTLKNLTMLDLSENKIGTRGMCALAKNLKFMNKLTNLNLSSNRVGNMGANALALAMPFMTILENLFISKNEIGDIGAFEIIKAVLSMTTLKVLELNENKIRDDGAQSIADYLLRNTEPKLKTIWLQNNKYISPGVKGQIIAVKPFINQNGVTLHI